MNKKAVSPLIATLALVAMTLVAAALVYSYVFPLFTSGFEKSRMCSEVQLSLKQGEFTYYDANNNVNVQVSRGAKEGTLSKVQIKIVDSTGNSYTSEQDATTLGQNEDKTFSILATDMRTGGLTGTPYRVAVAAVLKIGGKDAYCDMSPEAILEKKTA